MVGPTRLMQPTPSTMTWSGMSRSRLSAGKDESRSFLYFAAVSFEGKLVDYAMYKKAKLFLGV